MQKDEHGNWMVSTDLTIRKTHLDCIDILSGVGEQIGLPGVRVGLDGELDALIAALTEFRNANLGTWRPPEIDHDGMHYSDGTVETSDQVIYPNGESQDKSHSEWDLLCRYCDKVHDKRIACLEYVQFLQKRAALGTGGELHVHESTVQDPPEEEFPY